MSQIIKKIKIEDLPKNLNLNIPNSDNTKTTAINMMDSNVENVNIDSHQFHTMSIIEDIHDIFFPDSVEAQLRDMNIDLQGLSEIIHYHLPRIDVIESITKCGPNGENKKVKIKLEGISFECLIINENGEYKLSSVTYDDGTTLQCNLSESEKNQIRDSIGLSTDVDIIGYHIVTINGHKTKLYILEGTNIDLLYGNKHIKDTYEALESYPSNALNLVFNNPNFKGFFAGNYMDSPLEKHTGWNAYAYADEYIYLANNFSYAEVVAHEFAHVLDHTLGKTHNYSDNSKFKSLFNKYKQIIIDNFGDLGGYGPGSATPIYEMPNEHEFFAKVTIIYLKQPNELEELMPDLYEYMENLFGGM